VRFAGEHGLALAVKGGGHNIAGLAMPEGGLVLDMGELRGVEVDGGRRIARIQAGALLADVDAATQQHGLAATLGFVSQTGVAGLTLGGGFGYLTRRFGYTCDNLVSMEVVTAAGQVVRAAADENTELFWALRGGGGNFGIVTSFEYKLYPVGPEILGGAVVWRAEDSAQVLDFYRRFTAQTPRETTCVAVLRIAPPAPWLPAEIHGKPIVAVFVCHSGDIAQGEAILAPLRSLGKPVADIVARRPYTQMQSLLDATQPKGRRYYWKSNYLAQVTPEVIAVAIEHAAHMPSPHTAIVLFQLQGALGELPAEHSPAGNRDTAFVLNITSAWEKASDDAVNQRWARDCFAAAAPYSTGGTYINFLTEDEGRERIEAAYGRQNLERLATLKRKYDPENLFRHTKSVLG
jgi:FAD/FMN-containing dehydrogenase